MHEWCATAVERLAISRAGPRELLYHGERRVLGAHFSERPNGKEKDHVTAI